MKNRIILLLAVILSGVMTLFAQNNRISYQAVVRDSTNHLVVETPLTVKVKLTDADDSTYSESHSVTSNPNGLISLWIGDGYDPIGNLNNLKWNSVTVESKIYRQSDGRLIAEHTLPLAAVPYSLYSENVNKVNLTTNINEYFEEHFDEYINEYIEEHPIDQVQSDWEEIDPTSKAYILRKPEIPVVNDGLLTIQFAGQEYTFTANQAANTMVDLGNAIAEPQVQSDWEETDQESKAYILHKPDINDGQLTIQFDGQEYNFTANQANNTALNIDDVIQRLVEKIDSLKTIINNFEERIEILEEAGGEFVCGTSKAKDIDGNKYETVVINSQCWMKTNLRVTKTAKGNAIANDATLNATVPHYYIAKDSTDADLNDSIYGYLYNWEAAKQVCPSGWHLPTVVEWSTLTDYLVSLDAYKCSLNVEYLAKALASSTGWKTSDFSCEVGNNQGENNATGFSAYPAGEKKNSTETFAAKEANFWLYNGSESTCRYLKHDGARVYTADPDRSFGLSVRCIRN